MTTLNHAVTGAAIAVIVKAPALAIPLALVSHYVCDVLPHFGIHEEDHQKRDANYIFQFVTAVSVLGMLIAFFLIPYYERLTVSWITTVACMIAATIPDIVWIPIYLHEKKYKQTKPLNRFDNLHQKIQWYEKPLGLLVELPWLLITVCIVAFRQF